MQTPANRPRPISGLDNSSTRPAGAPLSAPAVSAPETLHQQRLASLGILASGTMHELKNLLTPITLATELAAAEVAPGHPLQPSLATILVAARRARDLVQRFAAYGAARPVRRQSVAVDHLAAEVLALLRPSIPATARVETFIAPALPTVAADPLHVHQVLTNLLMNAWQALPSARGRIELRGEAVSVGAQNLGEPMSPAPGAYVRLSVTDDGIGMEAATRARIFEEFFTTKAEHGSGLGLAIVRAIVREYRGGLTVESSPGHGATFRIYWPIVAQTTECA